MTPALRDELAAWRERSSYPRPTDFVFANGKGGQDNRNNVRRRLLEPAIAKANRRLVALGIEPIADLTAHGLRRTYATLRHATGDEAAYASAQLGHTDATFTMNVYTRAGKRLERMNAAEREAGERAFAWASRTGNGTSAYSSALRVVNAENAEATEAA